MENYSAARSVQAANRYEDVAKYQQMRAGVNEARPRSPEWFQVLERWVAQPSANARSGKLEPPKPRTWNQPSML